MFQKAREDMEKEMQSGGTFESEDCFQPMETDYAAVERQVDVQAAQLTKAYLAKLSSSGSVPTDSVRTQVHLVYKFLNTPEELLQQGMGRLAPKQLSQFYKQLAKQLHPDKNAHPQAKDAFQRVQAAIECVKARHQRV